MKAGDLKSMSLDQLDDQLAKLKKEQFNLRFQKASGQLENTSRVRQVRRDIARVLTLAGQKRGGSSPRGRGEVEDWRVRRDRRCRNASCRVWLFRSKNNKTIVVEVERRYTHPLLKKTVRRTKKYHAHDEENVFKAGDRVEIQESGSDLEAETLGRAREDVMIFRRR